MNESISTLNKSECFSINDFFPKSTKIKINRHISIQVPCNDENHQNKNILQLYMNNNKLMKKENSIDMRLSDSKKGKSFIGNLNLNLSFNNPSTYETSLSNSIFDIISPQIKNLNLSNTPSHKILVYLRPKSDLNKFK